MPNQKIEDGISSLCVIRTTFETLDLFASDDPIRKEMEEIVHDARDMLILLLQQIATKPILPLGISFNEIISHSISKGLRRDRLDAFLKISLFDKTGKTEGLTGEDAISYRYPFPGPKVDSAALLGISARLLVEIIVADILAALAAPANYQNKRTFDREVAQRYYMLMLACYASSDPLLYAWIVSEK